MSQRTPVAEVEPTESPGADDAASPGEVAYVALRRGNQPDPDLSPKAHAALVRVAKLLGRQFAEEQMSQRYST